MFIGRQIPQIWYLSCPKAQRKEKSKSCFLKQLKSVINWEWIIQEANEGSKMADSDNCSISFEDWKWFEAFDLKVDLFADHLNTRSSHFCAQYYSPEVWAIDAFSISWNNIIGMWICPLVNLLIKICFPGHLRFSNNQWFCLEIINRADHFHPKIFQETISHLLSLNFLKIHGEMPKWWVVIH